MVNSGANRRYVVIALADGVSTCKESKKGAEIACNEIVKLMIKKAEYFFDYDTTKIAKFVMEHITFELEKCAILDSISINELSSTLTGIIYDKKKRRLLYVNLGDSLILATQNGMCKIISKPFDSTNGCPVTTTKNSCRVIDVNVIEDCSFDSFFIFSDGAWNTIVNGNDILEEVKTYIINKDYGILFDYIRNRECDDDYSFVLYDSSNDKGRLVA